MNHDNKMAKPDSLDFKVHYFQQRRKKRKANSLILKPFTLDTALDFNDEIGVYIKNSDNSFNLSITTAGTNSYRPIMRNSVNGLLNEIVIIRFNAAINSGLPQIKAIKFFTTVENINYNVKNGINEIIINCSSDTSTMDIYWNGTQEFDITVTDFEYYSG